MQDVKISNKCVVYSYICGYLLTELANCNMKQKFSIFLICLLIAGATGIQAQTKTLVVKAAATTTPIQPTMWGLFFEDINFAADGGIYAELVKNRSFEFYKPLMGWKKTGEEYVGQFQIINSQNENNPRFLRLESLQGKELGLVNEGCQPKPRRFCFENRTTRY